MRPVRTTDAHETDRLAEMVCSNSFRSDNPGNAVGLLKREMELARVARHGGGAARGRPGRRRPRRRPRALRPRRHGADRRPSRSSTSSARRSPALPDPGDGYVVVATGPLTSPALSDALLAALGGSHLYFYDSVAPIVEAASIDHVGPLRGEPLGKGGRGRLPERPALARGVRGVRRGSSSPARRSPSTTSRRRSSSRGASRSRRWPSAGSRRSGTGR